MDSPQWDLPQRYEDTSTDDCMKQSVCTEFITVRSPAAQTTSSLSFTLTLQEGRKHVQRRQTNVFFSSEQIKIWSSSPPEEAIWMWKENRGQLWMCVWFHKATGGSDHTELLVECRPDVLFRLSPSMPPCSPCSWHTEGPWCPPQSPVGGGARCRMALWTGPLHTGHWQHKPQILNKLDILQYHTFTQVLYLKVLVLYLSIWIFWYFILLLHYIDLAAKWECSYKECGPLVKYYALLASVIDSLKSYFL